METKEIIQNNKLTAEFMEGSLVNADIELISLGSIAYPVNKLMYHTSWDWLMPVVEKIESLGFCTNYDMDFTGKNNDKVINFFRIYHLRYSGINVGFGKDSSKIMAVYKAVVEFIQWYNLNKHL